MAVTKIKPIKGTLNKALDYIQNPAKTDEKMLVSSFGCSYETADIEFGFTLSQALDKGSNLAHHLIQAFEPGEVDYQTAHEIGRQLAAGFSKVCPSVKSGTSKTSSFSSSLSGFFLRVTR